MDDESLKGPLSALSPGELHVDATPTRPGYEGPPPVVLAVDDEPLIVKTLELMLTKKGCKVVTASSGVAGLEAALRIRPDLILLDVMMPDMDGFETCRRIKNEPSTRHIPVLLVTALNDVFHKVKGLDAGADDFISKPFNETELRARVWAFLRTKRLHDELERSYRRLQELEEFKDSLTHMIMHDLMAPITAVQLGLETVLANHTAGRPMEDVHARLLHTAESGCRKLTAMLKDVLTVGRLEARALPLAKTRVSMAGVVDGCLSLLEPARRAAGISFRVSVAPGVPDVMCDPELIGRVITNLVSNSLKFTDKGGTVTVSVKAANGDSEIECAVADTGIGIAPAEIERVFDKFYQGAAGARRGIGLGLAFCRMAVEAHGGRVWAESEPGKGSRFVFRLPV